MQEQFKGNTQVSKDQCNKISLSLPNAPEYVGVVRLTLSGIANRMGFNIEEIEDLKVAVAEACTNAITHGCGDGNYTVEFSILQDKLQIEVVDTGKGFDYKRIQDPDLTKPREGGLGIFIIKSLMDEVEFFNNKRCGTRIIMSKKLGDA